MKISFSVLFFFITFSILKAQESSPYEACKEFKFVTSKDSKKTKKSNDCDPKIKTIDDAGFFQLTTLNENVEYIALTKLVIEKINSNLNKSIKYAQCSALCFKGKSFCSNDLSDDNKNVDCQKRKKDILKSLNLNAHAMRSSLALSRGKSDLLKEDVNNILNLEIDHRLNKDMIEFEIETDVPVGKFKMTDAEIEKAKKVLLNEKEIVEKKYQKMLAEKNVEDTPTLRKNWTSMQLIKTVEERQEKEQEKYRQIMYSDMPLLAVLERPDQFDSNGTPQWSDEKISKSFDKLISNSKRVKKAVEETLKYGKLEFSRSNGTAIGKWFEQMIPGNTDKNDLLFYMQFKNQVEEVLKDNKNLCGAAFTLNQRLESRELQNTGVIIAGSFVGGPATKASSKAVATGFRLTRALTGAEASALTGLATGVGFLGDSFNDLKSSKEEVTSGIGNQKKIKDASNNLKLNLIFAPTLAPSGWLLGKKLYKSLGDKMAKEFPELKELMLRAKTNESLHDELVDNWIQLKLKNALNKNFLGKEEAELIKSDEGAKMLNEIAKDISNKFPDFFDDPENFNLFLKMAASTLKKRPGDPSDLSQKATELFLNLDTEIFKTWDPIARQGLMSVFSESVNELRKLAKNDIGSYLKLSTSKETQEKILAQSLRNLGVIDEAEINMMKQCAIK